VKSYPQINWILVNFLTRLWTKGKKKPANFSGFMYFFGLYWIMFWWRRRESNPRPKIFHCSFYVRILWFVFAPENSQRQDWSDTILFSSRLAPSRKERSASPPVWRPHPTRQTWSGER